MKNKKLILKEEADDEIKFADDDVFYSEEEPLPPVETEIPVVVDEPVEVEVPTEIVHTAYNDILQDLLKKQWDVINSCDAITATLDSEEGVEFDKEAVKAILQTIADETTKAIGMTTKAMTLIDPTQDELMKEGERKAEDAINVSEKETSDEPVEESYEDDKDDDGYPALTGYESDAESLLREIAQSLDMPFEAKDRGSYDDWNYESFAEDYRNGKGDEWVEILEEEGLDSNLLQRYKELVGYHGDSEPKGESLGESTDVYGLFAIEIDPKTGKKVADVEGGKAIERGSKEELQPKVREYESSWNVNPQGKTYRFSLKRITSESMDEDLAMISQMNSSGFHGFDDMDEYLRYWAWYTLGELESHLDNLSYDGELDDLDEDDDYQIINHLSEEDIINLCTDMAGCLVDNDYLWETAYSVFCDCLHEVIVRGHYADRAIPEIRATVQLGGNNPNEGEQ